MYIAYNQHWTRHISVMHTSRCESAAYVAAFQRLGPGLAFRGEAVSLALACFALLKLSTALLQVACSEFTLSNGWLQSVWA